MRPSTKKSRVANALAVVFVAVVLLFLSTLPAKADGGISLFSISDIAGKAVGFFFYAINYIMATIFGIFIAIEAWFIQIILQLNNNIVNTFVVQTGESVTLSLANLGFVLGIIIIAIATILRRETYGIKQTLWKLVVAAIIVNFSLVIGGVIINFATTLTNYFMASLPGQGGGAEFAGSIASMFQPQQFLSVGSSTSLSADSFTGIAAASGAGLGSAISLIASVIFALINLVMIVVVLDGLFVMLLIRYVILSILLILAPLAWLTWVFPSLRSNFSKWWGQFIRWTFFPPLVVFFLWLVLRTADLMNNQPGNPLNPLNAVNLDLTNNNGTVVTGALTAFFGNVLIQVIPTALRAFILMGLTVGGLIAANSLGIAGASATLSAAKGAGAAIGGYMGKQAKKGVRATYQAVDRRLGITEGLQKSRIPGFSMLRRGLASTVERGGKGLVEADAREAKSKDSDRLALELQGFMGSEKRLAFIKELQSRGDLDKVKNVGGKSLTEFLKDEKLFTDYGQGKLYGDVNKTIGSNKEMRAAALAIEEKTQSTTVVDAEGVLGRVGATVKAHKYLEKTKSVEATQRDARNAIKDKGPDARIVDTEGLLGVKGAEVSAVEYNRRANGVANTRQAAKDFIESAKKSATITDAEGKTRDAAEVLNEASEKFARTLKKEDLPKMQLNDIYSGKPFAGLSREASTAIYQGLTHGIAVAAPQLMPSMVARLKSDQLNTFAGDYVKEIDASGLSKEIKGKRRDALEKSMANNDIGVLAVETPAPAAEAAAPQPAAEQPKTQG